MLQRLRNELYDGFRISQIPRYFLNFLVGIFHTDAFLVPCMLTTTAPLPAPTTLPYHHPGSQQGSRRQHPSQRSPKDPYLPSVLPKFSKIFKDKKFKALSHLESVPDFTNCTHYAKCRDYILQSVF